MENRNWQSIGPAAATGAAAMAAHNRTGTTNRLDKRMAWTVTGKVPFCVPGGSSTMHGVGTLAHAQRINRETIPA